MAQTESQADVSVTVTSVDGWARLILSPCHQYFTVQYLSHLSNPSRKSLTGDERLPRAPGKDLINTITMLKEIFKESILYLTKKVKKVYYI